MTCWSILLDLSTGIKPLYTLVTEVTPGASIYSHFVSNWAPKLKGYFVRCNKTYQNSRTLGIARESLGVRHALSPAEITTHPMTEAMYSHNKAQ